MHKAVIVQIKKTHPNKDFCGFIEPVFPNLTIANKCVQMWNNSYFWKYEIIKSEEVVTDADFHPDSFRYM